MSSFLGSLFSTDGYMPHGHCYLWQPSLVWTMVVMDSLIGIAYVVISATLYFLVRKVNLPFHIVFLAFGAFILACGATHFMEVYNLWVPNYWLSALVKVITATASVATAFYLLRLFPGVLQLTKDMTKTKEGERVKSIVDHVIDGIITINEKFHIESWNPAAENIFGYRENEVLGKNVNMLMPEPYHSEHDTYVSNYLRTGKAKIIGIGREVVGRRKDGTTFPMDLAVSEFRMNEKRFFTGIVRDITERKASEERYRLFVESVKDYALLMLDTRGNVLSWNPGAERVKGYKSDEIVGQNFSKFYTPEEVAKGTPKSELNLAEKEGRFETEGWRVRKDRSRFWASVVITALRDVSGRLQGFGKVTRDLTERKKQEEKFQSVVESVPTGIVMVNDKGELTLCNSDAEKMFGYARTEILGSPIEKLVPKRFRDKHPNYRNQFIRHPQKRQMGAGRDLTGLRKDGTEFPVEIGLNPLQTIEGNFVLAAIVDITERKKMEGKLKTAVEEVGQKNQEMEQFVYTVSHDLKAPLVTSASFLQFLREDIEAKRFDEVKDSLDRLDKSHKRMQELINDLLQLSRVGRLDLEIQQISLNEILSDLQADFAEKFKEKKMILEVASDLPEIPGDRKRIQQVFENLIGNALKYASDVPEPKVQILWKDAVGEIQVCVKDNGPGIEPQYHKKIFGLFQRLQTDKEGTGVGLTIVSRVVQLHGGRVWVNSDVGRGSEFWVAFPKTLVKEEVSHG